MPPDPIAAWFTRRVPTLWCAGELVVRADRDEIVVLVPLVDPAAGAASGEAVASRTALVKHFRAETRDLRVALAAEAEHLFERKVSWGAACGDDHFLFTTLTVPVMTRLRMGERAVLDTLLDAGVARSRSEALAWCVRLVERHQAEWIGQLRQALVRIEELRAEGPS